MLSRWSRCVKHAVQDQGPGRGGPGSKADPPGTIGTYRPRVLGPRNPPLVAVGLGAMDNAFPLAGLFWVEPTGQGGWGEGLSTPGTEQQDPCNQNPRLFWSLRLGTHSKRRSNQRRAAPSCGGVTPLGLYRGCCSIAPTTPRAVGATQMQPNTNPMGRCNSMTGQNDATSHRSSVYPHPDREGQGRRL